MWSAYVFKKNQQTNCHGPKVQIKIDETAVVGKHSPPAPVIKVEQKREVFGEHLEAAG